MSHASLRSYPPTEPILLKNKTCVYCRVALHAGIATKEHVIGRRFVPRGKPSGQWNLIVRACKSCNERKAALEDDISAITMQPDTIGAPTVEDEILIRDADSKGAGSLSRWTRKPVRDSYEKLKVEILSGSNVRFVFNLTGLPTLHPERMFELALLQECAS